VVPIAGEASRRGGVATEPPATRSKYRRQRGANAGKARWTMKGRLRGDTNSEVDASTSTSRGGGSFKKTRGWDGVRRQGSILKGLHGETSGRTFNRQGVECSLVVA